MTSGNILIKDHERSVHLCTYHDGHASTVIYDMMTLPQWMIQEPAKIHMAAHADAPDEEELRTAYSMVPKIAYPHYAGIIMVGPDRDRLRAYCNNEGALERAVDSFCYFDSPDALGLAQALTCKHWNRWFPVLSPEQPWSSSPHAQVTFECEDYANKNMCTTVRAHLRHDDPDHVVKCVLEGFKGVLPAGVTLEDGVFALDFRVQFLAALREAVEQMLVML